MPPALPQGCLRCAPPATSQMQFSCRAGYHLGCRVLLDVARALTYLHAKNVVHMVRGALDCRDSAHASAVLRCAWVRCTAFPTTPPHPTP